ncbi:BPI fold-containing family B member 4-like [Rhinatrema bivittatum]|uniref:BPI fold-containing family B member 4-like n=1 Tax=Rhinatrema bivittatum TaxID=194408 RepID=UPI00112C07F2|nr:BPI fold-containing family B member 4-like [Rhinatrema bivittatum]
MGVADGVLDNVVDTKNLLENVLAGSDGLLGDFLQGVFAPNSLFGDLGGTILRKNGLVGQPLDKNGFFEKLLSKDGIIGQLLCKEGLIGRTFGLFIKSLLTKYSLLSLLSEGGELGPFDSIPSIKILDLTPPKVSVTPLSGNSIQISLNSDMGVGGRNPMGHQLHTMMGVNITTIAKMSTDQDGSPRLITENCKTTVENMDVKVQNGLQGNIPQLLNPILNKALLQLVHHSVKE